MSSNSLDVLDSLPDDAKATIIAQLESITQECMVILNCIPVDKREAIADALKETGFKLGQNVVTSAMLGRDVDVMGVLLQLTKKSTFLAELYTAISRSLG